MQQKKNSRTQLVSTLKGSKRQHVKTKQKGANVDNMRKKSKWVAASLSQENIDYIASQAIYILANKRVHKNKKNEADE